MGDNTVVTGWFVGGWVAGGTGVVAGLFRAARRLLAGPWGTWTGVHSRCHCFLQAGGC